VSEHRTPPGAFTVDLTNCDREPIHIPGSIQPHGALLVLEDESLRILQCGANSEAFLGVPCPELLRAGLPVLLDGTSIETIRQALALERPEERNPLAVTGGGKSFQGILHRHAGATILELEPHLESPEDVDALLRSALSRLQAASGLRDLFGMAVAEVKRLTGFDRVMIYHFEEDQHGEVIAEAREPDMEAYLGLHYPASDIPAQARELYRRNWLRLIPTAGYEPVPLVPPLHPGSNAPLDLSRAVLRSVSPIHLEYLANMGVRASMSISLVVREQLWGLISCIHRTPRWIPYRVRAACELLGRLISLQIAAISEIEAAAARETRRAPLALIVDALKTANDVFQALASVPEPLLELVSASGAALVVNGGCQTVLGRAPEPGEIERLAGWLQQTAGAPLFHSASLRAEYAPAESFQDVASGLLALAIPRIGASYLMWFRPEVLQTVTWGGDPNKPVEAETPGRLHPRRSFEAWKETVRATARRWTPIDLDIASDLRRHILEIDLARQVLRERAAVQARDDLVAVVSHDLRNPLSVIQMQLAILGRSFPEHGEQPALRLRSSIDRIQRSVDRMLGLTQDLLDLSKIEAGRFAIRPSGQSVDVLVQEAIAILRPLAETKGVRLHSRTREPMRVQADAERIFQVFSNIVGNAIKFTPEGGAVEIEVLRSGHDVRFCVSDTGPGVDEQQLSRLFDRYWQASPAVTRNPSLQGAGLGLYIAKGIVEAHGGRIWTESALGEGLRVYFTLPTE
jgi:two-component system, chemotaxis family, sensor kinase Cph1